MVLVNVVVGSTKVLVYSRMDEDETGVPGIAVVSAGVDILARYKAMLNESLDANLFLETSSTIWGAYWSGC